MNFEEAWETVKKDYPELTASSSTGLSVSKTRGLARYMFDTGVMVMNDLQDYKNFNEWFDKYGEPEKQHSTIHPTRMDLAEKAWEAATYLAKPRWTLCKDALPEDDKYVLWKYDNGFIFEDCIDRDADVTDFLKGNTTTGPVVAWMPLLEEPDGKTD